jgi:hypothetical protein
MTAPQPATVMDDLVTSPRQREIAWISEHAEAIAAFSGEWVAVSGDQIVAPGTDLGAVLVQARRAGHADPLVCAAGSAGAGG